MLEKYNKISISCISNRPTVVSSTLFERIPLPTLTQPHKVRFKKARVEVHQNTNYPNYLFIYNRSMLYWREARYLHALS